MKLGLNGKTALVTGAGSQIGFGRAIAVSLAEEGCDVAINDINLEDARKTAAEVEKLGRRSMAIKADVTSDPDWTEMVKKVVDEFGRIDILVNNAGGCTPPRPYLEMTNQNWNFDITINLYSTHLGTKTVLPTC